MEKYIGKENYSNAQHMLNVLELLNEKTNNILGLLSIIRANDRVEFLKFIEDILKIKIGNVLESELFISIKKEYSDELNQKYFFIELSNLHELFKNKTYKGGRVWLRKIKNEKINGINVNNFYYINTIDKRRI